MHVVSVFFADTVNAKTRQTSTMTSIILASPCGDRETMQASSAYNIPHTARRTWSIAGSGPIDIGGSLQVHQLGEDDRILAESLNDNS